MGAGLAGAAAAWRLAQKGHEVVLLEQFQAGHNRGSSHGPTRIFRFAYEHPGYVRMAQMALPLWRELEAEAGHTLLWITGGLDAGSAAQLDAIAAALDANGAKFERLGPDARSKRFPQFELVDEHGLYSPDGGVVAAGDALAAMLEAARIRGAEVRESNSVLRVVPSDDGVILTTSSGDLRARRCIVAAGAWARMLLDQAGIPLPLEVSCEQVFYFDGGEDLPVFIHRNGISHYLVPPFGGAPGTKIGEHATGRRTTADARPFDIEPAGETRVRDYVKRTFPSLNPEPVAAETCLYTLTPDENFVFDRIGPIVIASPCSGHGFKFGPLIGEILAALATDGSPPVDIARFSVRRFNE